MYMLELIRKSLTTTISPMVYIMMFVNVFIGFCFVTGLLLGGGVESVLYSAGVLVEKQVWGGFLLVTASISLSGMIWDKDNLLQFGGIVGFMLWLFASISLAMQGLFYVLISVALFHLLFHGYIYLSTTMGYLRRKPIR